MQLFYTRSGLAAGVSAFKFLGVGLKGVTTCVAGAVPGVVRLPAKRRPATDRAYGRTTPENLRSYLLPFQLHARNPKGVGCTVARRDGDFILPACDRWWVCRMTRGRVYTRLL